MPKTRRKSSIRVEDISVGSLFLDSGAHTLWNEKVGTRKGRIKGKPGYVWFDGPEFTAYLDEYAAFVKDNLDVFDYYANVDVIYDPQRSWKALKYLEKQHGLTPVPVIHWDSDIARTLKWIKKHLDAGYDYLGLGGLGQGITAKMYYEWADKVFAYLCPAPSYLPIVKTHGFAMTAYDLLLRWPWFSVDSASWTKIGAFGSILVPHKRKGKFTFAEKPYIIAVSQDSPVNQKGRHLRTLTPEQYSIVQEWLALIGIPLGKAGSDGEILADGVVTRHSERKAANLIFFEHMRKSLPEWPWPFLAGKHVQRGRFAL